MRLRFYCARFSSVGDDEVVAVSLVDGADAGGVAAGSLAAVATSCEAVAGGVAGADDTLVSVLGAGADAVGLEGDSVVGDADVAELAVEDFTLVDLAAAGALDRGAAAIVAWRDSVARAVFFAGGSGAGLASATFAGAGGAVIVGAGAALACCDAAAGSEAGSWLCATLVAGAGTTISLSLTL